MTEQENTPRTDETLVPEDVEGHMPRIRFVDQPEDDVEGHRRMAVQPPRGDEDGAGHRV